MATLIPNSTLLISGILRKARAEADALVYLTAQHAIAFAAVAAGDEFIKSHEFQGQSADAERGMTAVTWLELLEAALQVQEAQEAATAGGYGLPGSVRHADFSQYPSTLG